MSFITDMFNTQKGSAFDAKGVPITPGTDPAKLQQTYEQSQGGLGQQQAFVNALQAQNGIQNQAQVYNQLQDVAAGKGPNPAMAALANATGANTANQAALMASQRGAGANAGLIARQAAQQGAANQQNAIGQGAALQAQQSLGALGQAGQMAGQQVGQQAGALGTYNQLAQNLGGQQQGALANQNQANVAMQSNINNANAGIAQENAKNQNKMGSGVLSAIASGGASLLGMADGGQVPNLGVLPQNASSPGNFWETHLNETPEVKPLSSYGEATAPTKQAEPSDSAEKAGMDMGKLALTAGKMLLLSKGGKVPAMVSPGERYLPPSEVKKVAKGKDPLKAGEKIPGKAKHKGNDYRNDTVPKDLESGGIVLPKSVMEAKDPHSEAHKFVSAILAKQGFGPAKKKKSKS